MPHNRYFVDNPLIEGDSLLLEGNESHHLTHVMRQKPGDLVELINGKNSLALAQVEKILKHQTLLQIQSSFTKKIEKPKIILAQALPKLHALELILEKGTELGADAFWLFPGRLSEKNQVKPEQLTKWRQWTIAALKQCGRLDLPEILIYPPLEQWEKPEGLLYFGDLRPSAVKMGPSKTSPLLFFIGPEKGFHKEEIELLEKKWQALGIKLHDNILRVETAAITALATCYLK